MENKVKGGDGESRETTQEMWNTDENKRNRSYIEGLRCSSVIEKDA